MGLESKDRENTSLDMSKLTGVRLELWGPHIMRMDHHRRPLEIWIALFDNLRLDRGKGILSSALNPPSPDTTAFLDEFDLDEDAFADSVQPGSCLARGDTSDILVEAKKCFEKGYDETGWNAEVHHPLLKKVFRDPTFAPSASRLVDFSICTTAPIIREYLPSHLSDRRIDFCLFIDPSADPLRHHQPKALQEELPELSTNHSSFQPLLGHPTTLSLETKKTGNDFDGGILQIAVWQAAQWKMLRSLLREMVRESELTMTTPDAVYAMEEAFANDALEELGALHGVLIQGHEWYYVGTSPELTDEEGNNSLRTNLWVYTPIGRMADELGIHKIAAFLDYMKRWTAESYWPWFAKYFLNPH